MTQPTPDPGQDPNRGWTRMLVTTLDELAADFVGDPYVYIDTKDGYVLLRTIRATDGVLCVGRHASVDLPLVGLDPEISRQHLLLEHSLGTLYAQDSSSANGTYLNAHRVSPGAWVRLKDRDTLRLGNNPVFLRVRVPAVSPEQMTRKAAPEPQWDSLRRRERQILLTLLDEWPAATRQQPAAAPSHPLIAEKLGVRVSTLRGYFHDLYDALDDHLPRRDKQELVLLAAKYEDTLRAVHEDAGG